MTSEEKTVRLDGRALAGSMLLFSGLGLPVTGIANHVVGSGPPSVARHAWMAAHNVLGFLFTAAAVWHIVLNRRALWRHVCKAATRVRPVSRETLLAGTVVAVALSLMVAHALVGGPR